MSLITFGREVIDLNGRIKRFISADSGCFIVAGDKGSGKSTTLALFADVYSKLGYKVFCQYPYKDCYQIPMVKVNINGTEQAKCFYPHREEYSNYLNQLDTTNFYLHLTALFHLY